MKSKPRPKPLQIQPKQTMRPQANSKRDSHPKADQYPCPVCGGKQFEWGYLKGVAYAKESKMMQWAQDTQPLRPRACLTCGNVMMFLDD